jgi:hypothetical protein
MSLRVNSHDSPRVCATSPPSTSPTWSPSTAMRPPLQPAMTSLTPALSTLTFHVTHCHLVFGNDQLPRVVSKPQQPSLPPSAPILQVREPIAHHTRSRAPAPLALFASGVRFHECIQYRIPTAKSSRAPLVAIGFVGLCAVHHMMTAETTHFAALCSALLHKDNPFALSVLDPTTGDMLEHCQLRCDPWYKTTWDTLYVNELCRLCQGISSGKAPNSKRVAGTNTFFCIDYHNIPSHKRKEICHTMVVCEVRPDKDNPNRTQITVGGNRIWYSGNVGTNTASLELLKLLLNSVSLKKVHALAPSTLRTSTLTRPCLSLNTFASKSWTSQTSSLTNTNSQVWTMMDGFTSKSARVATACPKQVSS